MSEHDADYSLALRLFGLVAGGFAGAALGSVGLILVIVVFTGKWVWFDTVSPGAAMGALVGAILGYVYPKAAKDLADMVLDFI